MKDIHNKFTVLRAVSPVSDGDNTALVSQIIDTMGYHGLEFLISTGSLADADATFQVLIEDGNASDLTGGAAVADDYLLGTENQASFQFDDDNETRKIGYVGGKRYVRLTITPSNNASAALISAVALLAANEQPTANPPV